MELKTVKYNYYCLNPEFKNEISVSNIIYLFYKNSDCLYICVLQDLSTQYCKEKVHTFAPEIFL